jgi:hypothetical protein
MGDCRLRERSRLKRGSRKRSENNDRELPSSGAFDEDGSNASS